MSDRFAGLKKIPKEPAVRLLAAGNARLATELAAPASAGVPDVLAELDALDAWVDLLRLLTVALPPREAIWWGCLAYRDMVPPGAKRVPRPLQACEAWVFKPSDETREAARQAAETAEFDDDGALLARAVAMHDGKLGPGQLKEFDAPPGGASAAVFGVLLMAIEAHADRFDAYREVLVDRALDIARGGDGRIPAPPPGAGEPGAGAPASAGPQAAAHPAGQPPEQAAAGAPTDTKEP